MHGAEGEEKGHRGRDGWKGDDRDAEEEGGQRDRGRSQRKLRNQEGHQAEERGGEGEAERPEGPGPQHPVLIERLQLQWLLG